MTNIIEVENKMITLRNQQVILDSDVADLYGVETKRVNEAVCNNPEKFPKGYIWELAAEEIVALRLKISTLKKTGRGQHSKYPPKAFTEKGLYMVFRRGFRLADAHTGELEVPPPPDVGGGMVRAAGREEGKDGRRERGSATTDTLSAAHLCPFAPMRRAPFRQ